MAFAVGSLDADYQTLHAANKPILLGTNACESKAAAAVWRAYSDAARLAADLADTDADNASFPTARSHDRFAHLVTKPTDVTKSSYALIFNLNEDTIIDSLVIAGHNFSSVNGTVDVRVWVSDNADFSAPVSLMAIWQDVTSTERLATFDLGDNGAHDSGDFAKYSAVKYLQICIRERADTTLTTLPQIGEVFLGPGRRISRASNVPWDDKHWTSEVADFHSQSGVRTRYTRNKGRKLFTPNWTPTGSDTLGLDDVTALETFYTTDTQYGTRKFFFCPRPAASAELTYLCDLEDPELNFALEGPAHRNFSAKFVETAPFIASGVG